MAWMNQKKKALLLPGIKKVLAKYGMKATFRVRHNSTLVCTLRTGGIDFGGDTNVNMYWLDTHYSGTALEFLKELKDAMNGKGTDTENFDKSDPMTDYFHVGWYTDINIGAWDKPYVFDPELTTIWEGSA